MSDSAATRARFGVTTAELDRLVTAKTGTSPLASVAALAGSIPVNPTIAARAKQDARDVLRDAYFDLQFAADSASKAIELSFYAGHTEIRERAAELKSNAIQKARKALAALEQS
jgi:hypothetical protein